MLFGRGTCACMTGAGEAGIETDCETLWLDFLFDAPPPKIMRRDRILGRASLDILLDRFFLVARLTSASDLAAAEP